MKKGLIEVFNAMDFNHDSKITEDEITLRNTKIQEATLGAIMVPLKVASISLSAMKTLDFILKYGNKQTVSDLGVAALSIASGIEGACLNILINLPGLDDQMEASSDGLYSEITPAT